MIDDGPMYDVALDNEPLDHMSCEQWITLHLRQEAELRHRTMKSRASCRVWSPDYSHIGVAGEFAFGRLCGQLPPYFDNRRIGGDGGRDFRLALEYHAQVKCSQNADNLPHEVGKPFADIHVLAEYVKSEQRARCIGWEWARKLRRAPTGDLYGKGVDFHYIPRDELRPMPELLARIKR